MRKAFFGSLLISTLLFMAAGAVAADEPSVQDPKVKVGDTAPDFTLRNQSGKEVKLSDFRGKKNVVLAFYVFAFTGG
jgi:cytochrome oxidase Cu insertion factor (SCO1/SenC/PrrC family)